MRKDSGLSKEGFRANKEGFRVETRKDSGCLWVIRTAYEQLINRFTHIFCG